MKRRLSKRIRVALPAEEAFRLFTPRGECEWAPGWDPTFPAPTDDDSEPGTVFQIDAHGHRGTWLVTDRAWLAVVPRSARERWGPSPESIRTLHAG